jgi:diadenosine tetraphosphate (Ap4A) HIT family hydrolase
MELRSLQNDVPARYQNNDRLFQYNDMKPARAGHFVIVIIGRMANYFCMPNKRLPARQVKLDC